MKQIEGYLSVAEAARRAGLSYRSMRARLDPAHPDAVPHQKYENLGERASFRIPEDEFKQWLEAHHV